MKQPNEWVLWGKHPTMANNIPLKIMGGTRGQCNREARYRAARKDSKWSGFEVLRPGEAYPVTSEGGAA